MTQQIEPIEIFNRENKGVFLRVHTPLLRDDISKAEILDTYGNTLDEWVINQLKKERETMYNEKNLIDLIQFLSMNEMFNGYGSVSKETAKYFLEKFKTQ